MLNEKKILEANDRFYAAFNSHNLDMMGMLWLGDPSAVCVHPGWQVLKGYDPIMQSWDMIFRSGGSQDIRLSDVEVVASEDLGWVSCQENLYSITSSGVNLSRIYATNVYRLVGGEWKLALHHASVTPASEAG